MRPTKGLRVDPSPPHTTILDGHIIFVDMPSKRLFMDIVFAPFRKNMSQVLNIANDFCFLWCCILLSKITRIQSTYVMSVL
jgi:hypothetical protein